MGDAMQSAALPAASHAEASAGVVATGLVKRFGDVVAVRDASFRLPARGVVGLLGPNGAGKTTTIRMIAGVLVPDAGMLQVAGIDALRHARETRARIGYLPESAPLYPELTVREHLRFRAGLAGIGNAACAMERAMASADVSRFADRCAGTLSKGMQQRVGLAATLLSDPAILILDEPSVGLDPQQALAFRALVRSLGETRLVVLSSHVLAEVEDVAAHLLVIAHGRVLADESMVAFRARSRTGSRLVVESERRFVPLGAGAFATATERLLDDGWTETTLVDAAPGDDARVGALLAREGIAARRISRDAERLEDIFVRIVAAPDAVERTAAGGSA